jgi:hypothetical protein
MHNTAGHRTYRKHLRNASSPSLILQHPPPSNQQSTMSYSYSNPYAQPQAQQSQPRSAFTTTSTSEPCQILFGGLPTDASENDLRVSQLFCKMLEADVYRNFSSALCLLSRIILSRSRDYIMQKANHWACPSFKLPTAPTQRKSGVTAPDSYLMLVSQSSCQSSTS